MKTRVYLILLTLTISMFCGCTSHEQKSESDATSGTENNTDISEDVNNRGQAYIKDDETRKSVLDIAVESPDHTILVKAVQTAELENVLVNAGPFTVFAPTDEAFKALPEGTVENLLKPENRETLSDILKYHVTPGNLSTSILTKVKKVGQANNLNIPVEVIGGEPVIGGAHILGSVSAGNGVVHVVDKVLIPPTE